MGLRIIDRYRGIWAQTNHATSLYYLLFTILGGLIISFLVGGVFCQLIYGISFFSSSNVAFDPNNYELIEAMKLKAIINAQNRPKREKKPIGENEMMAKPVTAVGY